MLTRSAFANRLGSEELLADKDIPSDKMKLYKSNIESSALLQLPPEIRNRIFRYVLGNGELIHMNAVRCAPNDIGAWRHDHFHNDFRGYDTWRWCRLAFDDMKLSHKVCLLEPGSDEELYQKTVRCEDILKYTSEGRPISPREDTYTSRHTRCDRNSTYFDCKPDMPLPEHRTLDLSLLKTCRQINKEAALMPLAHNTFSFNGTLPFNFFVSTSLRGRQRAAIRRIHFNDFWFVVSNPFRESALAQVTGITQLYVFLTPSDTRKFGWDSTAKLDKFMFQLSQLRVRDVRVLVSGPSHVKPIGPLWREEAMGWEELLRTGETEYEFKW